jgi:hypothetical protein
MEGDEKSETVMGERKILAAGSGLNEVLGGPEPEIAFRTAAFLWTDVC